MEVKTWGKRITTASGNFFSIQKYMKCFLIDFLNNVKIKLCLKIMQKLQCSPSLDSSLKIYSFGWMTIWNKFVEKC